MPLVVPGLGPMGAGSNDDQQSNWMTTLLGKTLTEGDKNDTVGGNSGLPSTFQITDLLPRHSPRRSYPRSIGSLNQAVWSHRITILSGKHAPVLRSTRMLSLLIHLCSVSVCILVEMERSGMLNSSDEQVKSFGRRKHYIEALASNVSVNPPAFTLIFS